MNADTYIMAASAFSGSAVAVWAVFSVMVAGIRDDVREVKASTLDAHKRLNRHIESHN